MVVGKVEGVTFGDGRRRELVKDDRQRLYRLERPLG